MSFKLVHQFCKAWRAVLPQYTRLRLVPGLQVIAVTTFVVTGLVLGARQSGLLQPLELRVYDRLVRLRPDTGPDPRLLIVAITEADLRALQRLHPSDQTLAQALAVLERHQPQVIGLDLYRDIPQAPGNAQLMSRLQSPNVIVITKLGNTEGELNEDDSVPPPPNIPPKRVGFNDLVVDPDGVLRRSLLFGGVYYSFSLRLALSYLATQGITPVPNSPDSNDLKLGQTVFAPLEPDAGGYQRNDAQGYQILLNYRSQEHVARQVTLRDVLADRVDSDWIKGKIVLLGTTAPSSKDLFYTPYSAGEKADHQMSGVEIHAQSVSQILSSVLDHRPLLWFWSEWKEWLWIGGWALAGGIIAWCIRQPLALGLSVTVMLMLLCWSCWQILMMQGWVPSVAPTLTFMATVGVVVTNRAQQAQQQQQMVMTLLGQNTSPEIATALWNARDRLLQSGKLPGQRLVATMLFTDIKDFSTVSEKIPPEALLDWLNEYLEAMTQAIISHHGIINKFTGDGLMAVFGVPIPRLEAAEIAQDAYQAVACALTMSDRLKQLNQSWQQRGLSPIQMRVGIFTGPVVVGSLGSKNRLEYGVIGDSVNIASRLESCAKERQIDTCRVLIGRETLEILQGQFQVEAWGPMALKGKQQLVEVYRVLGHHSGSTLAEDQNPGHPLDQCSENSDFEAETKANSLNL